MCKYCDWEDMLATIEEMMDDDDFDFAYDTLSGIKDWVEENHHITERQTEAVNNIRESIERRR